MKRNLLLPSLAALAAALMLPDIVAAQSTIPAPAALSDADALAAQMRIIAAEPTDVAALAQAGELSARVGDLSGAASLFARADKVDPHNGRVKAGMAEVLLRSERPGEALRFFDQAEGYGYPPARFAAERGLAYDLLGQQGRAQRDYRLVLATGENAEVRRRYALSLAISGQNEAALQQLDPLIRKNDRGAWRSRAFIIAMGGDAAAAGSIATTMMAPGQAQGLAPFFARLSSLGPVDRAFAVHFGELRPTAQRIADARLAPALPPFAPEVVQVVRAAPVAPPAPVLVADRRHKRKGEVQVAAVAPVVTRPAPLPPSYGYAGAGRSTGAPAGGAAALPAVTRTPAPAPVALAVAAPPARLPAAQPAPARTSGFGAPYYYPGSMLPHYLPRQPAAVAVQPAAGANPGPTALASLSTGASRPASAPAPALSIATARPAVSPAPATGAPLTPATPVQLAAVTPALRPSAAPASPATVTPIPSVSAAPAQLAAISPAPPSSTVPSPLASVAPAPRPPAAPVQLAAVAPPNAGFSAASEGVAVPSAAGTLSASAPAAPVATMPVASPASTTPAPSAVRPAVAPPGATTTGDAVLARIAEALAIPGRELAAAGTVTPATPVATASIAQAPVSSAGTPVATQRLPTDFPSEPMMVNGQLTTAGRTATARRHRTFEIAASAPPPEAKGAAIAAAPVPDSSAQGEHPSTRRGRRATVAATDADAAKSDTAAPDRPTTRRSRREIAAAVTIEPTPTRSRHGSHAATDETGGDDAAPTDRKASARQTASDRKAATDKKAATEKKALADKDAADERRSKKAEPGRYWVQVAGGANEDDLPKAWSAAKSKAPALAARKGWTTPLHATNRVVTGPFKTDEEARAFVNTLKKQGVSAFPFTSEAGQKISRLDDK